MSYFKYPIPVTASLSGAGLATEDKQDDIIAALGGGLNVVDQIDTTPVLDTTVTTIPKSSGAYLTIVASTAAGISKLYPIDDIGEYMGLYVGGAGSEVLLCILPLGGGEVMDVIIPIASRISIRAMKDADIVIGNISINFIG